MVEDVLNNIECFANVQRSQLQALLNQINPRLIDNRSEWKIQNTKNKKSIQTDHRLVAVPNHR